MKKRDDKNLAEGEVTGHAHRVNGSAEVYDADENGDVRMLRALNDVDVTHEEHQTVRLPAGEYDIRRQVEYDPDLEEARRVAD